MLENSKPGMKLINKLFFWPGGKPKSDSIENIIVDNIVAILGWIVARLLDKLGAKYGLYKAHIK